MNSLMDSDIHSVLSDHEVRTVLIWALVGPLAVVSYLLWKNHPNFRAASIPLFCISFAYFLGQWGGIIYMMQRLLS